MTQKKTPMKTPQTTQEKTPRSAAQKHLSRRDVLKIGATSLPLIFTACAIGKGTTRNGTMRLASIGTGRMGSGDMRALLSRGLSKDVDARIVAVCDVDSGRAARAKQAVESIYKKKLEGEAAPEVDVYTDFRELLAREDIDGVSISTPDFWHAELGVAAARAGKDIYIQKPLTYSVREGQALVRAVREAEVVLQVGSQQRSDKRFRQACELVRNGRIGKLEKVVVWLPPDHGKAERKEEEAPAPLDYDFWMGPTARRPYIEKGVHPSKGYSRPGWLQREGYCRGMITGWGSHMNDIAQWGHGTDRSGIVEIAAKAEFPERGIFDVHTAFNAEGKWADGVVLIQETNKQAGVHFYGTEASIFVRRGGIQASDPEILKEGPGPDDTHLQVSNDHYRNFLDCMRSRKDPIAPVEVGHRSNTVCVITHIAMKLGRKLVWDPDAERFKGDDEANAMLDFDRRAPWLL